MKSSFLCPLFKLKEDMSETLEMALYQKFLLSVGYLVVVMCYGSGIYCTSIGKQVESGFLYLGSCLSLILTLSIHHRILHNLNYRSTLGSQFVESDDYKYMSDDV
jgi:hypothetical protein